MKVVLRIDFVLAPHAILPMPKPTLWIIKRPSGTFVKITEASNKRETP